MRDKNLDLDRNDFFLKEHACPRQMILLCFFSLGVFSFHSDNDNEALNLLTHSRSPRAY